MDTLTKDLPTRVREESLEKHDRARTRMIETLDLYEDTLKWMEKNLPEADLINVRFDIFNDLRVNLVCETRGAGQAMLAEIVRACNLKIEYRPSESSVVECYTCSIRDAHPSRRIYINIQGRNCKRVPTGEKRVVEEEVFTVVCEGE